MQIAGNLNINPKEMSKNILDAVASYLNDTPHTNLREIDIVIFQQSMVHDFVKSMQSALKEKKKSFFAKVSDWFSSGVNYVFGGIKLSNVEGMSLFMPPFLCLPNTGSNSGYRNPSFLPLND